MTETITPDESNLMRRALGLDRLHRPYRNKYCATPGSDHDRLWAGLAMRGLAVLREQAGGGQPLNLYEVTEAGRAALAESWTREQMVTTCLALMADHDEVTAESLGRHGWSDAEIAAHGQAAVAAATAQRARLPQTARVL
jgi:hypothetical protein